jgi:hypothetical protein
VAAIRLVQRAVCVFSSRRCYAATGCAAWTCGRRAKLSPAPNHSPGGTGQKGAGISTSDPSTHGAHGNGKDAAGRFAKGNKLGRGNPLAGRGAKIRAILLRALTPADTKAIAAELVKNAKAGDLAIRKLLDRTTAVAAWWAMVKSLVSQTD